MQKRGFVNKNLELNLFKGVPRNPSCTLLIPEKDLTVLRNRLSVKRFHLADYLRFLLRKYRNHNLVDFSPNAHYNCCYQGPGQSLVRRNFSPNAEEWVELGVFANFLGISRCRLFVVLMYMDTQDVKTGVPVDALQKYDLSNPEFIQCKTRFHITGGRYKRNLSSKPKPFHKTPHVGDYLYKLVKTGKDKEWREIMNKIHGIKTS